MSSPEDGLYHYVKPTVKGSQTSIQVQAWLYGVYSYLLPSTMMRRRSSSMCQPVPMPSNLSTGACDLNARTLARRSAASFSRVSAVTLISAGWSR